jgi:ubiquitin C-terminal hydrolase
MAIVVPIQYNGFSDYNPGTEDPSQSNEDLLISREVYNYDDNKSNEEIGIDAGTLDGNLTGPDNAEKDTPSASLNDPDSIFNDAFLVNPYDDVSGEVDDDMDVDQNEGEVDHFRPASSRPSIGSISDGRSEVLSTENTCHMNSALQVLARLDVFSTDIQSVAGPVEGSDDVCASDENLPSPDDADIEIPSASSNDPDSIFDGAFPVNQYKHVSGEVDDDMGVNQNDGEVDDLFLPSSSPSVGSASKGRFGGLSNMGNTCYMNSALQILASLDVFTTEIQSVAVPVEGSDKLRRALKDVLERLARGETVRPEDFKRAIDERTSLFLGYRQQDSHEFLTTLLDLIDEDYKKKENVEEMKQSSDQLTTPKEGADGLAEVKVEDSEQTLSNSTEDELLKEDEEDASTLKKQKLDVPHENEHGEFGDTACIGRVTSLVDLQFGDIENLLHGDKMDTAATSGQFPNAGKDRGEPKCKLVGGRMNPAGVEFTRYQQRPDDFEAAANVSQETSKSQEGDHDSSVPPLVVNSPIESNFTTEVRVCLTCESCMYRRSHTETFLHLSLEIGSGCSSIEDGLRKFFAQEKREIKCEKCFHSCALQTSEITKLPRALLFHFKRFIVDVSPDYTSISYRKDQSPVSFEETIGLSEGEVIAECLAPEVVIPKGVSYGIRGVVNHIGASASCGHYTADAKRLYGARAEGREWTRFNDSIVSKISSQNAVENSSRTAYMVMYELEE